VAVENFLMSMGTDREIALMNLAADTLSYKWNDETLTAIRDGIWLAQREANGQI
jgi:hypothetical protein